MRGIVASYIDKTVKIGVKWLYLRQK